MNFFIINLILNILNVYLKNNVFVIEIKIVFYKKNKNKSYKKILINLK